MLNNKIIFILCTLLLVACTPQEPVIDVIPRNDQPSSPELIKPNEEPIQQTSTTVDCMGNLERFSGTYSLDVVSKELGIQDYQADGEEICGPGDEFFGESPTTAIITVSGQSATLKVNINGEWYDGSGAFQKPSTPKKPLVGDAFYKKSFSVEPGINSCNAKSPYFSIKKSFSEDGGSTDLTLWVYMQKDAINIVAEPYWSEDGWEILSKCHGVIILQGKK